MTGAAIDACAARTRILHEAIGAKCSTCGARFPGICETVGATCSTCATQATGAARKQGVTLDALVSENSGGSAKQGVRCNTLVRRMHCDAADSRLISRLCCATRTGFSFRSRLYSRLRRIRCLRSAGLSDCIGCLASGFSFESRPRRAIESTISNRTVPAASGGDCASIAEMYISAACRGYP